MATTTPNYGWTVPTSTDLVKDGATAIETLGDAIDASMNTALGTKKAGMVLLNTTSFSGVSSQSFSSVFDKTTYNYWRVAFRLYGSVSTNTRIRGRANTTDISSGVYGASYYADYGGSAAVFSSSNNAAQMTITAHSTTSASLAYINADVSLADDNNFHWTGNAWSGDGAKAHFFGFNVGGAGANGFSIIPTSGTITGTCSIFAYNK